METNKKRKPRIQQYFQNAELPLLNYRFREFSIDGHLLTEKEICVKGHDLQEAYYYFLDACSKLKIKIQEEKQNGK